MDFQVQVGMRQKVKVFEEQLDVFKQASGVLSLSPSDENEMEAPKIITLRIKCFLVFRWNGKGIDRVQIGSECRLPMSLTK